MTTIEQIANDMSTAIQELLKWHPAEGSQFGSIGNRFGSHTKDGQDIRQAAIKQHRGRQKGSRQIQGFCGKRVIELPANWRLKVTV